MRLSPLLDNHAVYATVHTDILHENVNGVVGDRETSNIVQQ